MNKELACATVNAFFPTLESLVANQVACLCFLCVADSTESPEDTPISRPAHSGGIRIAKEFIESLPIAHWEGPIELIESEKEAERAIHHLHKERVLGFDTETRPSHTRGVSYLPSVLQLAGEDRIFVFRLDVCGGIPLTFPLLCHPKKAKVGVAVRDDVRHLQERAPFDAPSFIDISDFTKKAGIENTGLRALVAHYLGLQMKKSKKIQTSRWERELSKEQIKYAANDAWFSRELYLKLEKDGIIPSFE